MAEKVLVVEDEPLVRDLVVFNLKHVGYTVSTAGDYASGLTGLKAKPDLAIIDVMFPGGDGFSLTEYLEEMQRHYLVRAMKEAAGVKAKAAHLLGYKNYQTLAAQLERLKVELPGT